MSSFNLRDTVKTAITFAIVFSLFGGLMKIVGFALRAVYSSGG